MIGKLELDHFKIINQLGHGGFSTVYLVEDTLSEKKYAAKVSVIKTLELQDDNIEDFQNVVKHLTQISELNFPSICPLFGYSTHNFAKQPFLTTLVEYEPNGSLREMFELQKQNKCPHEWDSTRKYIVIYGIAAGMEYLHKNHIIHRDLKPENILLDEFLFPKISDFLLSSVFYSDDENDNFIPDASRSYMAPEIFSNVHYNQLVDVYAFGIIMYEILTGEKPYDDTQQTSEKSSFHPSFSSHFEVDEKIKSLIESCWNSDPTKRPSFIQIVDQLEDEETMSHMHVNIMDFNFYRNLLSKSNIDTQSSSNDEFSENSEKTYQSLIEKYIHDHSPHTTLCRTSSHCNDYPRSNSDATTLKGNTKRLKLFPARYLSKLSYQCRDLVKRAENGEYNSMAVVGQSLIEGKGGFMKNVDLGIRFLDLAAENDCYEAAEYYAQLLLTGAVVNRDLNKAAQLLQKPVFHGSTTAKVILVNVELSKPTPNYTFARKIAQEAAIEGNTDAMVEYGKLCMMKVKREHLAPDFHEAYQFFKSAADLCNSYGKAWYAYFIHFGYGVVKYNYSECALNAKESSEMGNMYGKAIYAHCLADGIGVEKDIEKAISLAKDSCNSGNPWGLNIYGVFLARGLGNLSRNLKQSARYCKMAADKGDAEGMCNYGDCLHEGDGVKRDIIEAMKYYKASMHRGCLYAAAQLGNILSVGDGVPTDPVKAKKYCKFAADHGDDSGMFGYALCLLDAIGTNVNITEASKYLEMGIERNNPQCMKKYAELIMDNRIPGKTHADGERYFLMAEEIDQKSNLSYSKNRSCRCNIQ